MSMSCSMPPDASLRRPLSIPSTVPTCLPSEPFTSMRSLICEGLGIWRIPRLICLICCLTLRGPSSAVPFALLVPSFLRDFVRPRLHGLAKPLCHGFPCLDYLLGLLPIVLKGSEEVLRIDLLDVCSRLTAQQPLRRGKVFFDASVHKLDPLLLRARDAL